MSKNNSSRSDSISGGSGAFHPEFNPEKYRNEFVELNLTEEQETELLTIMWSIMYSFVQLGFDVKNCGQIFESFTQAAQGESDAIDSSHSGNEEKPSQEEPSHE